MINKLNYDIKKKNLVMIMKEEDIRKMEKNK